MMSDAQRTVPPITGSEKEMLIGYLNLQRDTLLWKLDGLDDEQLRRPHQPSGLTLLGLAKHLTDVERGWFQERVAGEDLSHLRDDADPERYWRIESTDATADLIAAYRIECAAADAIIRERDLDATVAAPPSWPGAEAMTVRWVALHLIEETARHVGHADLIREAIDGATGE